jgi:hypothetical protein
MPLGVIEMEGGPVCGARMAIALPLPAAYEVTVGTRGLVKHYLYLRTSRQTIDVVPVFEFQGGLQREGAVK